MFENIFIWKVIDIVNVVGIALVKFTLEKDITKMISAYISRGYDFP